MGISHHPERGTILICDYNTGFQSPEMIKKRPVIVISPRIKGHKATTCLVVPLSTTAPSPLMPFHYKFVLNTPLTKGFPELEMWVKADMINAVAFRRLDFIKLGKDKNGKNIYRYDIIEKELFDKIMLCIQRAMGLSA